MSQMKECSISLIALLNSCNMAELQHIRRTHPIKGASQLNKNALVQRLSLYLLEHLEQHLGLLDPNRYNLLLKVMKAGSMLPFIELADDEVYEPGYFQQYGFLFLDRGAIIMPYEVRERLLLVDTKRLKTVLDRNKVWIQLTQGLLFYYGNMKIKQLVEKVEHLTGQSVDYFEYWQIINELEHYDYSVQYTAYGFSHFKVEDPQYIDQEHRKRPELDYYPITKAQALRAADDEYVDRHAGYHSFVSFLRKHWEMDEEEADLIVSELIDRIKQGDKPAELITLLQSQLELIDLDQIQQMLNVLMPLMNKTRLWILKGHSPEELFVEEKQQLKPLPQHPFQASQTPTALAPRATNFTPTVYNFQTKTKVGRNDSCPCGSGKKFKKCCGTD